MCIEKWRARIDTISKGIANNDNLKGTDQPWKKKQNVFKEQMLQGIYILS